MQYDPETGKSFQEIRKSMYDRILDEVVFVSRASEGAVSMEWIMEQPVHVRERFVKSFSEELAERKRKLNSKGRH